ncbi:hypothetical protein GOODEAATRI_013276 [Goodea atripinnis]|uniref:DUF3668 domain-containing protein n=1 Tax=Goodea atripinnis TaxID=208336 RepID=A0ABV0N0Z8_9TELE
MLTWLRSLTNSSSLCPFWKAAADSHQTSVFHSGLHQQEEGERRVHRSGPPIRSGGPTGELRLTAEGSGSASVTDLLPDKLEAQLIQDQGYHQVGPADRCTDMFVLSVTVAFATKLEQLIPSTKKLSAEDSGFFFYYSLLGNDITSEPFHNLLSPDFEPERASVRIRSSEQVLQAFLSQQPSLQIHLCCGNHSLGSTDVSLSALAAASVDLQDKAATVDGAFILQPPKRIKLPALPADLQPTVGVAVTLRREELAPQQQMLKILDLCWVSLNLQQKVEHHQSASLLPKSLMFSRFCGRVPLVVELWDRGSSSRDQLMGLASVQLHHLLSSEKTRSTGSALEPNWRQTHQDRIPVLHPQRRPSFVFSPNDTETFPSAHGPSGARSPNSPHHYQRHPGISSGPGAGNVEGGAGGSVR